MEVTMAVIADAANVSREGKLNVLGIFDTIGGVRFPVVHPTLTFAIRLLVEFEDREKRHHLEVSLIDEDNRTIWNAAADVGVGEIGPGEFKHLNQVLNLRGVRFERPGRYRFRVRIEGHEKPYDAAFQVVEREGPPPAPPAPPSPPAQA